MLPREPDPVTTARRRADPQRLRADWAALRASHHHLHAPQAATMLGVPEAALTACRIGDGAIRLRPEPAALLAPATGWHRVLVAHGSAAGVHLLIGQLDIVESAGDRLQLASAHLETRISTAAVAHVFWFVEQDAMHGRTRSLQLFDAAGRDVLKLLVMHRAAAAAAEAHFAAFFDPDQTPGGQFANQPASEAVDLQLDLPGRPVPIAGAPAEAFRHALAALPELSAPVAITTWSESGVQTGKGRVTHVRSDANMVHLHEQTIRMHLRAGAITRAEARTGSDGAVALAFSADGRPALTIAPLCEPDKPRFAHWVAGLLAKEAA